MMPDHVALVRELFIDRVDPKDLAIIRVRLAQVAAQD